jgi:hypothetical protein
LEGAESGAVQAVGLVADLVVDLDSGENRGG